MNIRPVFCATPALLALLLAACASGSATATAAVRAPISADQVKIYLEAPGTFEVIGLISASSDAGWTEQGSVDYAMAELKRQAAKLGANGVLLQSSGEKTTAVLGTLPGGFVYSVPVTAKVLQGRAIYVSIR